MIRLVCRENFLEYAGDGFIQCGRHVICPKKKNNKVLGYDCISYIDSLPEGYELKAIDNEESDNNGITIVDDIPLTIEDNKPFTIEGNKPVTMDDNKPITIDNRKSITIENEKIATG